MDWSNWISVLVVAMLVLCCGAMMIGTGRGRHQEGNKHDDKKKQPEDAGTK